MNKYCNVHVFTFNTTFEKVSNSLTIFTQINCCRKPTSRPPNCNDHNIIFNFLNMLLCTRSVCFLLMVNGFLILNDVQVE